MEPRALLKRLMADRGLNPNSLSRATHNATKQSQIHRFIKGESREPKRSTLEPVAQVFGIPVEAFFDPSVAEQVSTQLDGHKAVAKLGELDSRTLSIDSTMARLVQILSEVPADQREDVASLLSSLAKRPSNHALANALLPLLQPVPAARSHNKRVA